MKLFNLDSPVMVFLSKVANLMILNVLTIICCIPIFTAGAAITALYYVCLLYTSIRQHGKRRVPAQVLCFNNRRCIVTRNRH